MGKLFHIDLNDQEFGRYDQDFRFGSRQPQARVLPREAAGRQQIQRPAAFRCARLSPERLRRREGIRQGLHADVHDPRRRRPSAGTPTRRSRGCCKQINVAGCGAVEADEEVQRRATRRSCWTRRWIASKLAEAPLPYEKLDQLTMEVHHGRAVRPRFPACGELAELYSGERAG